MSTADLLTTLSRARAACGEVRQALEQLGPETAQRARIPLMELTTELNLLDPTLNPPPPPTIPIRDPKQLALSDP